MSSDPRFAIVALLPQLRRFARALTRDAADADDLVQTAVARALERLAQWRPGTRLDSWLYRIVQTVWIDETRKRRVRQTPPDLGPTIRDGERELVGGLLLERTRAAMARLPEEQRVVIALVAVQELTYREAAEVLDIPVGTVMSRLARGRRRLWNMVMDDSASEVA